jgi:glycosyltransferase involved in cell wall biosynthesis
LSDLTPRISIIVPAYNNVHELARCLDSLQHDELRHEAEIIVVDDCSSEEGPAIKNLARKYNARYYRQSENTGPGVARNLGASKARGDILVFIDSDCVSPEGWLTKLIQPIKEGSSKATTACYSGPVFPSWITTFQDEDYCYRMPTNDSDTSFVNSCNFAIKRKLFIDCGGFPSQRISEDMVLGLILAENGTPAKYLTGAGVKHDYHNNLKGYLRQRFSFAYNTVRSYLDRDHKKTEKANSGERSFNPLRTALGMFFISSGTVCFIFAIISFMFRFDVSRSFAAGGLLSLLFVALVHGRFLFFLNRRLGLGRTISYLPLLALIDFVYVHAVLKALLQYGLKRD